MENGKFGTLTFKEHYSGTAGQIFLHSRLFLPVEMVGAREFAGLEEWVREVSLPRRSTIMFKKVSRKLK